MINEINIPEEFEFEDRILLLLNNLLNILTFDIIFLSEPQNEGENPYYFITLFVDINIDPIPQEVLAIVQKVEIDFPEFKLGIFTEESSSIALQRGNLYFVEHVCLGHTLYSNPDGEILLDYKNLPLATLIKSVVRCFNSEMQKINAFVIAADKLIAEKQFETATFNLHQAFELTFNSIEKTCTGRGKTSHSIISHIKYCEQFFPKTNPFKTVSDIENSELLVLLEHAYCATQYGDDYEISKEQVDNIRLGFNNFLKEIEILYNKHLNFCMQFVE